MLVPNYRPELPALEGIAVAQMEKWIKKVVGDHISFSRLNITGHHDEEHVIAEKPVLKMSIKGYQSSVVLRWIRGALLEIKREQRETISRGFGLSRAPRKTE